MSDAARLRIVDFSTHLSGPMLSSVLVGLGADVVKVEHPKVGDGNRHIEPHIAGMGDLHVGLNPGTRSLAASTRSRHWPDLVTACARWADAVIVGARPVDAARRGLDFETMKAANPDVVYCLLSGYGLKGPWMDYGAHGQNPDALAGNVDVVWDGEKPGTRPGWRTAGSSLAGIFGAAGLLAGIIRRDRGGGPQFVHASLWQTAFYWNWRDINQLENENRGWSDYSDKGSRYSMYVTADDHLVLCCPIEKKFWEPFCDILGLSDEMKARGDWSGGMFFGYDDEWDTIAAAVRRMNRDELMDALQEHAIPSAPVLSLEEAIASEHAAVNGAMQSTSIRGRDVRIATPPVAIYPDLETASKVEDREVAPPPEIGADAIEVLAELGLDVNPDELATASS